MNTNTNIKRYKFRRLPPSFWKTWNNEVPGKSIGSHVFTLITHMVMQRFKDDEITSMIYAWHRKYRLEIKHSDIPKSIAAVKAYTLEERRRIKRDEMRRYRANRKARAVVEDLSANECEPVSVVVESKVA